MSEEVIIILLIILVIALISLNDNKSSDRVKCHKYPEAPEGSCPDLGEYKND